MLSGFIDSSDCPCRCLALMSLRLQWTAHDARSSNHSRLSEALKSLETHLLSNFLVCTFGALSCSPTTGSRFTVLCMQGDSVRKEELWTWLMKDAGHLPIPARDKSSASQVALDLLPSRRRFSKKSRPACDKLLTKLCQTQSDKVLLSPRPPTIQLTSPLPANQPVFYAALSFKQLIPAHSLTACC